MTAREPSRSAWSSSDDLSSMPVPMTLHALRRYEERLPDDAVDPAVAWRRGEDVHHPQVFKTLDPGSPTPSRVRVYNHGGEYYAAFIVCDDDGTGPAVVSVYNRHTHAEAPTRAYLYAHGPHNEGYDDE
jgi:hypothetical protein